MMLAISSIPGSFSIDEHYPGVYLNYTELQIILYLLRGRKLNQIAFDLGIARRSIDYYCCNMMKLLGFHDLEELIQYARHNELLAKLC